MIKIDSNMKVEGKPQAAFVILYALDGQPWLNYPEYTERKELRIPTCLMINRSDGNIGFIGGKVEANENLEEAAKREVLEEVGYAITATLQDIVAHDIGHLTTHAFALQLSYAELRSIQENALKSTYSGNEVTGVFLPHLIDYQSMFGKGGGISELIKNSFAPSVREELMHFLLIKKIFSHDELAAICKRSNYLLEDLIK